MSGNLYFQVVIYYLFTIVLQDFLPQKIYLKNSDQIIF